jgi:hypothetical protein
MPSFRADLALLGLAVVGVLSDLACVLTGHPAPALFEQVALAGLAGAAGVAQAVPKTTTTTTAAAADGGGQEPAGYSGPVGS